MEIKRICSLCYSATGNTARVVGALAQTLAAQLQVPIDTYHFTKPEERVNVISFAESDLVVVGSPTYAGKLPNKLLPDFRTKLSGNGAQAVAVVTYGGRSYDNALAELTVTLTADGFSPVAAGAFVGQHSFSEEIQRGRPDAQDLAEVRDFAQKVAEKMQKKGEILPVSVPGDAAAPYYTPLGADGQPVGFLKAKPKTDSLRCDACGLCADLCPVGSIDRMDPVTVFGPCIKCYACVKNCPKQAKYFDDSAFLSHVSMLNNHCQGHKKNEFFL